MTELNWALCVSKKFSLSYSDSPTKNNWIDHTMRGTLFSIDILFQFLARCFTLAVSLLRFAGRVFAPVVLFMFAYQPYLFF